MRLITTSVEEHQRLILESGGEGICGIDLEGKAMFANPAAARMLGYAVDEIVGSNLHEKMHARRADCSPYPRTDCPICRALVSRESSQAQMEVFWHRSGEPLVVEFSCTPILDGGRTVGAVFCFRDVECRNWLEVPVCPQVDVRWDASRAKGAQQLELIDSNARLEDATQKLAEANSKLARLASGDGLTGLKNHRAFQERLTEEIYRAKRYGNSLSLLLLNVDRFKHYNDAFGHPEGDLVLRQVASLLQETLRSSDVAARYGGEEFAVILPEADAAAARLTAERARAAIERATWPHRAITVSVGVATLTDEMETSADLIVGADRALCRSKQRGRNCITHNEDTTEEFDFRGGSSLPYTEIMREILTLQDGMLVSAAEWVKDRLIDAYDKTIESWCKILDMKDKETEGHSTRVTNLTVRLARSIAMNEEEVLYARWGALLHDIGKMGIPDSILLKPGALTEDEWIVMRRHPTIAFEMLSPITFLRPALGIPYAHHEKWDGTGYPQGLQGDEIPLIARLFAVIDVYDALRSDRPYRKGWPEEKVCQYLRDQAGKHFDPRAVESFLSMLQSDLKSGKMPLKRAA